MFLKFDDRHQPTNERTTNTNANQLSIDIEIDIRCNKTGANPLGSFRRVSKLLASVSSVPSNNDDVVKQCASLSVDYIRNGVVVGTRVARVRRGFASHTSIPAGFSDKR